MTKDEIARLPTPETDALALIDGRASSWRWHDKCISLERRLATAVMVIERAMRVSDLSLDKEAVETLAAIRGDK